MMTGEKMSRLGLIAAAAVCSICSSIFAPVVGQPRAEEQPAYVIEVGNGAGCIFAPVVETAKRGELHFTLPVSAVQTPDRAAPPTVSLFSFSARRNGEVWNIAVNVGRGEFYDARGQQIAAFSARTGERVLLNDMARYGLDPFRIAVVNVIAQAARPPRFTNRTQSLIADKIEAKVLPEPYRIFLRDASDKDVMAVQYNTYKGERMMYLKWLESGPDEPLIRAGETFRLNVLSEDHTCADADGYRPAQSDRVELASAVFSDGSYEGEPGLAAMIKGDAIGNRKQLRRVVPALGELDGREVLTRAELIYELKELSASLDEEVESYLLDELQSDFPTLDAKSDPILARHIRHGEHEVRNSLLADARRLEVPDKFQSETAEIKACLSRAKTRYEHWLSSAERMTAR